MATEGGSREGTVGSLFNFFVDLLLFPFVFFLVFCGHVMVDGIRMAMSAVDDRK